MCFARGGGLEPPKAVPETAVLPITPPPKGSESVPDGARRSHTRTQRLASRQATSRQICEPAVADDPSERHRSGLPSQLTERGSAVCTGHAGVEPELV